MVADVLYHPYWQSLAGATEETGVHACWSEPIRDSSGEILGAFDIYKPCPTVTHESPGGSDCEGTACRMLSVMRTGHDIVVSDEILRRHGGTAFPVESRATPIRVGGSAMGVVVTFLIITERKRSEEQILRLAYYDSLTGLPNRTLFKNQLANG